MALCLLLPGIGAAEERCGVVYKSQEGHIEFKVMSALSVSQLPAEQPFVLPAGTPQGVVWIQCGRNALALSTNDYKYALAGYVLSIVAQGRVGVLEVVNGQLQFRMLEGTMMKPESEAIAAALHTAQQRFDVDTAKAP